MSGLGTFPHLGPCSTTFQCTSYSKTWSSSLAYIAHTPKLAFKVAPPTQIFCTQLQRGGKEGGWCAPLPLNGTLTPLLPDNLPNNCPIVSHAKRSQAVAVGHEGITTVLASILRSCTVHPAPGAQRSPWYEELQQLTIVCVRFIVILTSTSNIHCY